MTIRFCNCTTSVHCHTLTPKTVEPLTLHVLLVLTWTLFIALCDFLQIKFMTFSLAKVKRYKQRWLIGNLGCLEKKFGMRYSCVSVESIAEVLLRLAFLANLHLYCSIWKAVVLAFS